MKKAPTLHFLPWLMWFIATVFFAYQFILRLFPALIITEIMSRFNITAAQYGILSAMYYAGYAGMQIPIAILLDKYGPRIILFICSALGALSSLIFLFTDNWYLALLARFAVGLGSAAGFLGVSKVISIWFSPKIYGRMISITFSLGLIGAVYGGRPVSSMISIFGWESVTFYVGLAGVAIAIFALLFISQPKNSTDTQNNNMTQKLSLLLSNKTIILLSLASLLLVGTLEGFADVWGVSYLEKAYNINKITAATIISFIFIGMIIGAPAITFVAEKLKSYHILAAICGIAMAVILYAITSLHEHITPNMLYFLMFFIGVFCCYQVLVLTIGFTSVESNLTGITIAFLNCINMIGGSVFHSIIGNALDYFWQGQVINNVRVYDVTSYNKALIIIPISAIIGSIIFLIVRFKKNLYLSKTE
jgi:predicted MFS family arabinose efflux permease